MTMDANPRRSSWWLMWTASLLLGLVLAAALGGGIEGSRAQVPVDVQVTKAVNMRSVLPGQAPAPLYTVTFTNSSTTDVILDTVSDTLPQGFQFLDMHPSSGWDNPPEDDVEPEIVWQGPITIPASSTLVLVYSVDVPVGVPRSTTPYVNVVTAMADGTLIGPASASILVGETDLSLNKSAWPTQLTQGGPITYTVVVANSGHVTGTVDLVTDTLDPALTFVRMVDGSDVITPPLQVSGELVWSGPFTVPALGELTLKYRVEAAESPEPSHPCNRVEALTAEGSLGPAEACVTVGIQKIWLPSLQRNYVAPRIVLSKSASPTEVTSEPGQVVTYTVVVTNEGSDPGTVLTVHDTLPAGFTYLGMAPGSDVTEDPSGTTGTITWTGPWTVAPQGQMEVRYRVSPSQVIGSYANVVNVTTSPNTQPPAGPASSTITVKTAILLEEDFEAGIGRWTPFLNYWRLEPGQWYWDPTDGYQDSGALTQDCCGGTKEAHDAVMMYLGDGAEQWTDYRVESKLILRTAAYPHGLWLRGQYEDSPTRGQWMTGYYVVLGGKTNGKSHYVRLSQLQTQTDCWGNACNNPENLYHFSNPAELVTTELVGPLERYRWYTLVVEARGDRITVWLDGEQVVDYVDSKEPFLTGTVGFKTYEAETVSFDDIIVTPLD